MRTSSVAAREATSQLSSCFQLLKIDRYFNFLEQ